MNIINERIIQICRELEDVEDDYTRARMEGQKFCEYITELEAKVERLEKEKEALKKSLINHINNFEND